MTEPRVGSCESTVSIIMQRIVEREQFGGEVKCQPSELRAVLESREQYILLARTLEAEQNDARARIASLEAQAGALVAAGRRLVGAVEACAVAEKGGPPVNWEAVDASQDAHPGEQKSESEWREDHGIEQARKEGKI